MPLGGKHDLQIVVDLSLRQILMYYFGVPMSIKLVKNLSLTRLKTAVGFINYIGSAFAANYATITMAVLQ